jgi:HemY protein
MRGVLTTVIAVALTVALAWWVAGLSGGVGATVAGYTIQTTTPVALLALVLLVLAVVILLRLLNFIVTLPRRIGAWRARRRHKAGEAAVTRTLVAIAAGDAAAARAEAAKSRRLLGDTPQTLLHAAEAARLAGREDEAAELFRLLALRKDAAFLGLRGLFRQAMVKQDWPEAARLAREAEAIRPGAMWLRSERSELAVRMGNWTQALALAGPGAPTAGLTVAAIADETDPDRALRMARRAWKDSPDFTPAAVTYAARLQAKGKVVKAMDVLRTAWQTAPHPDLATQALAPITNLQLRVKEGMRLISRNPNDAESHFLLAKLALEAGLLNESRVHAERARAAGMNQQRLWLVFADIEAEQHGDTEAGRLAQRDALRQATMAEADPGWRCDACGTPQPAWLPACPVCHSAGRISWGLASRPRLLAAS